MSSPEIILKDRTNIVRENQSTSAPGLSCPGHVGVLRPGAQALGHGATAAAVAAAAATLSHCLFSEVPSRGVGFCGVGGRLERLRWSGRVHRGQLGDGAKW